MDRRKDERAADLLPRPQRLVRRLCWLYGSVTVAVIVLLLIAALPSSILPQTRLLAREVFAGGLGAIVLASLLLALTALVASLAMTVARARHAASHAAARTPVASGATAVADHVPSRLVPVSRTRWSLSDPGFVARQGQALIVTLGTILVWLAMRLLWPRTAVATDATAANIAAAFAFAIAFVSLMAERVMHEFPAPQLPEAPLLRRLLLLVTVLIAAAACTEIGRSATVGWIRWPELVLLLVPALIGLELALRALARLFLPPPLPLDARSVADSVIVGLLTGGPRAPGNLLRTHFGLDFARSWALSFVSAAILPALLGTALLCWGLSGLKLIDLSHRGVYERFGAPVAVYGPGLHLLLPWPFGRLRPVEYGAIHSVAIGVDPGSREEGGTQAASSAALSEVSEDQVNAELEKVAKEDQVTVAQLPAVFAAEGIDFLQYRQQLRQQLAASQPGAQSPQQQITPLISAEATAPLSLNRLWESAHADQAHYLVASQGTGQAFQSVDTEIYVLYRVGLSNEDALQSIYTVSDPESLIREDASRLVLRYFNSRTLDQVLYAQREDVAGQLRSELARDIATYHTGADIVSVLIEEIHPPSGAAEAYHAVQAAEINSRAAISDELGRAERSAGVAQQDAHKALSDANAQATETRDTATAAAYRFSIDRRAYAQSGRSFVLERLYENLTTALKGKPLTIMDHRLSASDGPMIDMRPIAQGSAPAGLATAPVTPATAPAGPAPELDAAFSNAD